MTSRIRTFFRSNFSTMKSMFPTSLRLSRISLTIPWKHNLKRYSVIKTTVWHITSWQPFSDLLPRLMINIAILWLYYQLSQGHSPIKQKALGKNFNIRTTLYAVPYQNNFMTLCKSWDMNKTGDKANLGSFRDGLNILRLH